jgi:hypothetical protein
MDAGRVSSVSLVIVKTLRMIEVSVVILMLGLLVELLMMRWLKVDLGLALVVVINGMQQTTLDKISLCNL